MERTQGKSCNFHQKKFHLDIGKTFFTLRTSLEIILTMKMLESPSTGGIPDTAGQGAG